MDRRSWRIKPSDLNLRLMRWRIMPEIKLETFRAPAAFCSAQGHWLLRSTCASGMGVRKITLVDSAKVSFSNPYDSPSLILKTVSKVGKPKAECAAKRLQRIYPGVEAEGVSLSIPCRPPCFAEHHAASQADVERLEKLIDEHDVIYLLMDSRESDGYLHCSELPNRSW